MENKIDYPIFRKLNNNRSYYHIINARKFEEVQFIGSIKKQYLHEAKQYPEILFIQDLIKIAHEGILESNENEWLEINNY
jgi:hypothetical protein